MQFSVFQLFNFQSPCTETECQISVTQKTCPLYFYQKTPAGLDICDTNALDDYTSSELNRHEELQKIPATALGRVRRGRTARAEGLNRLHFQPGPRPLLGCGLQVRIVARLLRKPILDKEGLLGESDLWCPDVPLPRYDSEASGWDLLRACAECIESVMSLIGGLLGRLKTPINGMALRVRGQCAVATDFACFVQAPLSASSTFGIMLASDLLLTRANSLTIR